MTSEEDLCRWAYMKAMRIAGLRRALKDAGRAVYLDADALDRRAPFRRFVLSRVELHIAGRAVGSIVYCNGFAVS